MPRSASVTASSKYIGSRAITVHKLLPQHLDEYFSWRSASNYFSI